MGSNIKILVFLAATIFLSACISTGPRMVPPPNGGVAVTVKNPLWISGIEDPINSTFIKKSPPAENNEYIEVVNAGFWLANPGQEISQLVYEMTVNIKMRRSARIYTRMIFENPSNPENPFIHEHYLDKDKVSTKGNHYPISNVVLDAEYKMIFEMYRDPGRKDLISKVEQKLISAVDNTSGCVKLSPEYKKYHFGKITLLGSKKIMPLNKVVVACRI